MSLALILAVGQDAALLEKRNQILRAAGFVVESESSVKQAIHRFMDNDYDLILMCHSIPAADRERLAILVQASGSHIPAVSVTPAGEESRDVFTVEDAPEKLVSGIEELLAVTAEKNRRRAPNASFQPMARPAGKGFAPSAVLPTSGATRRHQQ